MAIVFQPLADDAELPPGFCRRRQSSERIGSAGDSHRLGLFPSSLAWVARACSIRPTDQLGSIASPTSTTTPPNKERN
jgi:hypothetical protein